MATQDTELRLVRVFEAVFPELPKSEIRTASQESVPGWETVAHDTLINVLEETFALVIDYDHIPGLNSFQKILDYLKVRLSPG